MKKKIILIGGGGHCKACIDVIEKTNMYDIIGILDVKEKVGSYILGYPIIGTDQEIDIYKSKTDYFLITIGQIGFPKIRKSIFKKLERNGCKSAKIISPLAHISKHTKIGNGTIIMHNAVINADSEVGENCIINTKAIIEHDVKIGNNCHISTGAIINGGVEISDNVFYGSGTISKEYIYIKKNVIIGGASFIRKSIDEQGTYAGNPLKKIK